MEQNTQQVVKYLKQGYIYSYNIEGDINRFLAAKTHVDSIVKTIRKVEGNNDYDPLLFVTLTEKGNQIELDYHWKMELINIPNRDLSMIKVLVPNVTGKEKEAFIDIKDIIKIEIENYEE